MRIYECLPLKGPQCGEPMRIIAFVPDRPQVERILDHVGESTRTNAMLPARSQPQLVSGLNQTVGLISPIAPCLARSPACRLVWSFTLMKQEMPEPIHCRKDDAMNRFALQSLLVLLMLVLIAATEAVGQEFEIDAHTLLLLHGNGSPSGASGENPTHAPGISYAEGKFGQAIDLSTLGFLRYAAAGNISAAEGTLEFWLMPHWNGINFESHTALSWGLWGGLLMGKDGGNYWINIANRWGPGGVPQYGCGYNVAGWTAGQWYHCAFTWSSQRVRIFVNGTPVSENPVNATLPAIQDGYFEIGAESGSPSLNGVIDELRISDIVRADAEILDSYLRGLPRAETAVAWGSNVVTQDMTGPYLAFSAGLEFAVALRPDGTLAAWGIGADNQTTLPEPNSGYIAVDSGWYHGLGLRDNGSVTAWGANFYGACDVPEPNSGFVMVSGGRFHSLALRADGSIVAWGDNINGQCVPPEPNADFISVSAGAGHSMGLKADGTIAAWGSNYYGESDIPVSNEHFVAIAAGTFASAALRDDGTMVVWGWNDSGQCNVPEPNAGFSEISFTNEHVLARRQDGSLVAWGSNLAQACEIPEPNGGFTAVSAGYGSSMAMRDDGSLVAWGAPDYGQADLGEAASFTAVSAGGYHTLGILANGSVLGMGRNDYGQCNVPEPNDQYSAVAAALISSFGLKSNGTIVAWGWGGWGELNLPSPNAGFTAIAAGDNHGLALRLDGSVAAWGRNSNGQVDVPEPNSGYTAISAGRSHSLGLKIDGSIVAWGSNQYGQCNVPEPNAEFVAIAAGRQHSVGLKSDGTVVAWGLNNEGQALAPEPNADIVAIDAGGFHNLALRSDGEIVVWGHDDFGQRHVPYPNAQFSAIAAGTWHSVALQAPTLSNVEGGVVAPVRAILRAAPNPFNPGVSISFELGRDEDGVLSIYDMAGRPVRSIRIGTLGVGSHSVWWDGRDDHGVPLPSGIYAARLSTSAGRQWTVKVTMIK